MNHKPSVSIIIPAYNSEDLICDTLDSLLVQTHADWECLVVDDGSTDNTKEQVTTYVNNDQRFKLFRRPEKNKPGGSGARNYGILKAQGKYIVFIDSDDLMAPTCLEIRMQKFNKVPHLDFLVFRSGYFNNKPGDIEAPYGSDFGQIQDYVSEFLKHNLLWNIMSPIWKKSSLLNMNGFDENLQRLQDVDLHTRVLMAGMKFRFYNKVDTYYRINTTAVKLDPSYFALKVLPSFSRYYQKTFKELKSSYLSDLQQGIMVTFKKYFLAQAKQNTKIIYRYIMDLSSSGMVSHKQRNVLNYLALCYALRLNKILGHKNLIRLANKVYYN